MPHWLAVACAADHMTWDVTNLGFRTGLLPKVHACSDGLSVGMEKLQRATMR